MKEENLAEHMLEELKYYKEAYEELKVILDTTFDFISIADENGIFLRVSKGAEKVFGVPESKIVGLSAYEVEKRQLINKSMTAVVLESKQRESAIQTTCMGKRFMVIGIPMFDSKGKLIRVINISRDITEIEKLNNRLKETEELLDWYRNELNKNQEKEGEFIFSENQLMKKVIILINQISNVNANVLLQGETGVGKNLIAKNIHQMSQRREAPFIQINCGAIPESLLESELFGYAVGAFTGANKSGKRGFFETANNGTIFLDEIGEIPVHLQVKLLHAIEHHEIYRIGSSNPVSIDVRIIAATNKDLKLLVKEGRFREDLYYRLNVLPIFIPPLRERLEDLPMLSYYFLRKYNNKYGFNKQFASKTHSALADYNWPGNIRELENTIERLIITCDQDIIEAHHVYNTLQGVYKKDTIEINDIIPLRDAVARVESELLSRALKKYKSTRAAGKALGIDQSTVVKKMQKLGISCDDIMHR